MQSSRNDTWHLRVIRCLAETVPKDAINECAIFTRHKLYGLRPALTVEGDRQAKSAATGGTDPLRGMAI
jgi:hypothetical protein